MTAPIPGTAAKSACTTARICGIADKSRKARITRKPRNADSPSDCGSSPNETIRRSKTFQALRKKLIR